jgi:hypothetical protein
MTSPLTPVAAAEKMREYWSALPAECFLVETFGNLEVGEQFISLPQPGDNQGHGGFKGSHHLFTKIRMRVTKTDSGITYAIPHGRAVNTKHKSQSDFPHSMPVLRVE